MTFLILKTHLINRFVEKNWLEIVRVEILTKQAARRQSKQAVKCF